MPPLTVKPVGSAIGAVRGLKFNKVIATGQKHHLLSTKIMRTLNTHPTLKGVYNRNDTRFIYRAADGASHRGYQHWHRLYDSRVQNWLIRESSATPKKFEIYLHRIHQSGELKTRIPNVNLID